MPICGGMPAPPLEMSCGARSMSKFMTDLFRRPDKVQAAFDVAMVDIIENQKAGFRETVASAINWVDIN